MPEVALPAPAAAAFRPAFGGRARPAIIALAYFALAATMIRLTRFDGGLAFIWVANALLTSELIHAPRRAWAPTLAGAAIATIAATSLFGLGVAVSPWMALCTVLEAALGAKLLLHFGAGRVRLDTLNAAMIFSAVAVAAPLLTAFIAAAAAMFATGGAYWQLWVHWLLGHALGTITFAPLFLTLLDGRLARALGAAKRGQWLAIIVSMLACLATFIVSFGQSKYPLLFLPILPLVYMSFRFGQIGAAVAVLLIAVVGGGLTAAGYGPLPLIALSIGQRMQFFQFYLAAAVLAALPVAAELSHRRRLFRALQHSEARFRVLTQRSSDVIISCDRHGVIDYVSPSITEMMGYEPEALIGTSASALIHRDDHAAVDIGYRRALVDPEQTGRFEYRGLRADGTYRWFESSVRGVVDEHGAATGVVSAVRDITRRKTAELALADAATTDPLTGLPNRRAFVALLEDRVAAAATGCRDHYCAIVDFDHFKQINDRLGHDAGDRALQAFAQMAPRLAEPGEMIARIGGEEFGLILKRSDMAAAERACEALCKAVADLTPTTRNGAPIRLTISIGVSAVAGSSLAAVMAAADAALYRAKAAGRDRVALADLSEAWIEPIAMAS